MHINRYYMVWLRSVKHLTKYGEGYDTNLREYIRDKRKHEGPGGTRKACYQYNINNVKQDHCLHIIKAANVILCHPAYKRTQ